MNFSKSILLLLSIIFLASCKKETSVTTPTATVECEHLGGFTNINPRGFKMGFSTWSYGPDAEDVNDTYDFLAQNGDIYSEQIDHKIPWKAWINNTTLPIEFTEDIAGRVSKKIPNLDISLSVSLLNTSCNDLLEDYDETIPSYSALDDSIIEEAYFKHLEYLVDQFQPKFLIAAMEVNDLLLSSTTKWEEYKSLMGKIRSRLKHKYPNLKVSESITLHNWYKSNKAQEITDYVKHLPFVAISFYPFLGGLNTIAEIHSAFLFLNHNAHNIAIVETGYLAEDLNVSRLNISIPSNTCLQREYLDALLRNALFGGYYYVIWWTHRDYDELWNTFPTDQQDIGKIWRDTGLLNEKGEKRNAFLEWESVFSS